MPTGMPASIPLRPLLTRSSQDARKNYLAKLRTCWRVKTGSHVSHAGGHWFKSSIVHHLCCTKPGGLYALRFLLCPASSPDGTWSGTFWEMGQASNCFREPSVGQVSVPHGHTRICMAQEGLSGPQVSQAHLDVTGEGVP